MSRGPSGASKQAANYLAKHPATPAAELAKRFKIDPSTIYRADWWKNNNKQLKEQA